MLPKKKKKKLHKTENEKKNMLNTSSKFQLIIKRFECLSMKFTNNIKL